MKYAKAPLSFAQQIELLVGRGLVVEDRAQAEELLSRVNYYRFSAYCLPFERERHVFLPGVRFDQIQRLYELDCGLRLLILEAIEPVEIATRTVVAHRLALRYGAFAHADPTIFRATFDHAAWLADVLAETDRSKETFVSHFKARYEEYPQLPIWAAVEIMSFGSLSKLFGGLLNEDKRDIVAPLGLHPGVFGSWLHTLVYVRNICAHHARLWNRELAIAPRLPDKDERWLGLASPSHKRLAVVLFLLNVLSTKLRGENAGIDWRKRVETLLAKDPGVPRFLEAAGLGGDWTRNPLWANR